VGFNVQDNYRSDFLDSSDITEKWEYNETVYQLFVDFRKTYDSVRREILNNILIKFGITQKLIRLIKICLNETYRKVRTGKHLPDNFPIRNGLKEGDALSPLPFNFALEYSIGKFQENQVGPKLNEKHQLLVSADDINLQGTNILVDTIEKHTNFNRR
jgi:hypothetical protein